MSELGSRTRDDDLAARAEREAHRQRLDAFLASRDAGHTLTLDSLRAGISLTAVVSAATSVADFADQALAIIAEQYRPSLHCKEGCSYCCRKPGVLITVPELLRIVSHIQSSCDEGSRAALAVRARRYAQQIEGRRFDDATNESVPCPLLVDERCSVYELRPLVCRGYNSTNVDACQRAHADTRELVPIFSVLKDVTDGATVGTAQCLSDAGGNGAMVDLGSALNIALTAGDEFAQAVVTGSAVLAPAQNSTWVEELWVRVQATAHDISFER